ncbi:hypothetical protein ES288_D11G350500v1 [Gossypium darwinii]|uniref:Leucine-rich repeat-containing N-terminal plant-type domain-containing protein n=1 Tax=Gossypium darwinii TaxID=34276 RepID=A0A5D2ASR4_GOSDA|nr:hypothetical protein ES288_D11G350500v1 [Gossypium darwinii]
MAKPSFLPPFMFGLLFATFGVILAAKYSSITVDQSALLALKSHITHDPHNFLTTNWTTSTSVCSWIGVTCGSKHYRVTALNLSSMDLTGTISSQLGNLSFLAWLDIHQNSFQGSLPIELTNLRRMNYLDLGNNSFNGEIPPWFGCFSKLRRLSLYLNNFIGVIPSTLGNLSKLERLSLGWNQISGRIPNSLFKCKELKFLSLFNNSLEGSIPTEIGNLTLLKTLGLGINHFKGKQCLRLIDVNFLYSRKTAFYKAHFDKIPSTIGNLITLEVIDLPYNNLSALKSRRLFLLINSNITTLDALLLKLRGDKILGRILNSLVIKIKVTLKD